jgi:hypothetical protein
MSKDSNNLDSLLSNNWIRIGIYVVLIIVLWFVANTFENNKIARGLVGLNFIFLTALLLSSDIRKISLKTVVVGFLFQIILAVFLLLTPVWGGIF